MFLHIGIDLCNIYCNCKKIQTVLPNDLSQGSADTFLTRSTELMSVTNIIGCVLSRASCLPTLGSSYTIAVFKDTTAMSK